MLQEDMLGMAAGSGSTGPGVAAQPGYRNRAQSMPDACSPQAQAMAGSHEAAVPDDRVRPAGANRLVEPYPDTLLGRPVLVPSALIRDTRRRKRSRCRLS